MKTSLRELVTSVVEERGREDPETKSLTGRSNDVVRSSPRANAKITALLPRRLIFSRYCIEDCECA
jgi:hypothetical protein